MYYQLEIKRKILSETVSGAYGPYIYPSDHNPLLFTIEMKEGWKKDVIDKILEKEKLSPEGIESVSLKEFEAKFEEGEEKEDITVKTIASGKTRVTGKVKTEKTKHKEWNFIMNTSKGKLSYRIRENNGMLEVSKFTCTELLNVKECLQNLGVFKCTTKTGK